MVIGTIKIYKSIGVRDKYCTSGVTYERQIFNDNPITIIGESLIQLGILYLLGTALFGYTHVYK